MKFCGSLRVLPLLAGALLVLPACGTSGNGKSDSDKTEKDEDDGGDEDEGKKKRKKGKKKKDGKEEKSSKKNKPKPKPKRVGKKVATLVKHFGSNEYDDPNAGSGTVRPERGLAVEVDHEGNVILLARARGKSNFGGDDFKSAGSTDVIMAKYTHAGEHVWSKRFGSKGDDEPEKLTVDPSGNSYAVGRFDGTIDFGGGPFVGSWEHFLVKLDASGKHVFSQHAKDARFDNLAATSSGEVVVVGSVGRKTNLTYEGIEKGKRGAFIVKLDAAGNPTWSNVYVPPGKKGGIGYDDVAVGADGSVVALGTLVKSATVGGKELTSAGNDDIVVVKYDKGGAFAWVKQFGVKSREWASSVVVDDAGHVVITGSFVKPIDFGGGKLVSKGSDDIFVVKLDASGNHVWSKRFGSTESDYISDLAIGPSGQLAVTGNFSVGIEFGSDKHTCRGSRDGFVVQLDKSGTPVWSKRIGGAQSDYAYGVAFDDHGTVVTTGNFLIDTNYTGGDKLKSNGGYDIYLLSFDK